MGDHLGTQGVEDFFAYFLHLPQTICDQRVGGVTCLTETLLSIGPLYRPSILAPCIGHVYRPFPQALSIGPLN